MSLGAEAGPSAAASTSKRLCLLSSINLASLSESSGPSSSSRPTFPSGPQGSGAKGAHDYLLPPNSLHPSKDLLILISRDAQQQSSSAASSSADGAAQIAAQAAAAAAKSAAAPAPTGMSDRFAAARAAMMAQQRAKLLAKQAAAKQAASGAASTSSSTAPAAPIPAEVAKPPAIRASLWRAADGADKAQRVWEVEIGMGLEELIDPESLKSSGHLGDAKEVCAVGAVEWVADGRFVAVALHIQRSSLRAPAITRQVLVLLDVQTGRKERVLQIDPSVGRTDAGPDSGASTGRIVGMRWTAIGPGMAKAPRSSSASLLADLPPLPDLATLEQPLPPHLAALPPHMLQRLLKERAKAAGDDVPRAPSEVSIADPKGLGKAMAQFPRISARHRSIGLAGGQGGRKGKATQASRLARQGRDDEDDDGQLENVEGVLAAWDEKGSVHVILSTGIYLGFVPASSGRRDGDGDAAASSVVSASISTDLRSLHVVSGPWKLAGPVSSRRYDIPLRPTEPGSDVRVFRSALSLLSPCQHLTHLSTLLFTLFDYSLVSLGHIRNAHKAARDVAAKWTRFVGAAGAKFATDAANELMTCVITGRAGEAAESLLLGHDSLTHGATGKMRDEMREKLGDVIARARVELLPALERTLVVLTELEGCAAWKQRFGTLIKDEDSHLIQQVAEKVQGVAKDVRLMQELAEAERLAAAEFYKWWEYESERQECLRRDGAEPRLKPTFDALTVAELLRRGFYSRVLDQMLMSPEAIQKQNEEDQRAAQADTSIEADASIAQAAGNVRRASAKGAALDKADEAMTDGEGVSKTNGKQARSKLDVALAGLEELLSTPAYHPLDADNPLDESRRHDLKAIYASNELFVPALPPKRIPDRGTPLHREVEEVLMRLEAMLSGAFGRVMHCARLADVAGEDEGRDGDFQVGKPTPRRNDGLESCNVPNSAPFNWNADGNLVARASATAEGGRGVAFVTRRAFDEGERVVLSVLLAGTHTCELRHAVVDEESEVVDWGWFDAPSDHGVGDVEGEVILLVRSPSAVHLLRVRVSSLAPLAPSSSSTPSSLPAISALPLLSTIAESHALSEPHDHVGGAEHLAVNGRTRACATFGTAGVAYWDLGEGDEGEGDDDDDEMAAEGEV